MLPFYGLSTVLGNFQLRTEGLVCSEDPLMETASPHPPPVSHPRRAVFSGSGHFSSVHWAHFHQGGGEGCYFCFVRSILYHLGWLDFNKDSKETFIKKNQSQSRQVWSREICFLSTLWLGNRTLLWKASGGTGLWVLACSCCLLLTMCWFRGRELLRCEHQQVQNPFHSIPLRIPILFSNRPKRTKEEGKIYKGWGRDGVLPQTRILGSGEAEAQGEVILKAFIGKIGSNEHTLVPSRALGRSL